MIVAEARDAVRVPVGALFRNGDGWAVYVVEGDRARLRAVKVGVQDDRFRVVAGGLNVKDAVVLFPTLAIQEGSRLSMSIESPR